MRHDHEITVAGIAGAIVLALLAGAYSWPSRTGTTAQGVVIEDTAGNAITSFGGGGGGSTFGSTFPSTGTAIGFKNGANMQPGTVDGSGNVNINCVVGCAGGSASNAADAVATSTINGQSNSWLYAFNGTTFDRLRVDGSKNLNVNINASSASVPVTGTFWQATQPVSGTFWQATQPVSGTFWQATQPVSGTVTTTPPSNASTNVAQFGGIAVSTGTGAGGTGIPRVTVSSDSSLAANQSTNTAQFGGTNISTGTGAGGTGIPRVTVSSDSSLAANQSVNMAQVAGTNTVTGGTAGSQGVGGLAASGATTVGNPLLHGGRAQNAEPTAVTNGQAVAEARDLVGKQITSPHANKENFISGVSALITTATNTQIIAAQAAGIKIYVTGVQCHNSGATGSLVTITSGSGGTALWRAWNPPTSSTPPMMFPTPIVTAAATGLFVTTGAASTSQGCSATGYIGT